MLRQAERPDEVVEGVPLGIVVAHLERRLAERLHDEGDRSALAIEVGDGERYALAALAQPKHDEMARLGRLRDVRRVDLPEKRVLRELLAAGDPIHGGQRPASSRSSRCASTAATWRR